MLALRVLVIGCGHVGLVTGGCLSAIGHHVICADRDTQLIDSLERGDVPFYEPHLDRLIQRNVKAGRLVFTSDVSASATGTDVAFLCVGVPQTENGDHDFSGLDSAAQCIAKADHPPRLLVERSTVPVETGKQLQHLLSVYCCKPEAKFCVAANPQLLREGSAVEDFLHPDRILLGAEDSQSKNMLSRIYDPIVRNSFDCPVHARSCTSRKPPELVFTSVHSAELIKNVSNAFLGVKISYANVLADLCERLGANVDEVTHAMGLDQRIGKRYLKAGIGYGGSRLPNDLRAFCRLGERTGVDFGIVQAAERVNRERVDNFFEKVQQHLWVLKDKRLAILGLAHKPETDDIRGSPAIQLFKRLAAAGAQVQSYDPQAMPGARAAYTELVCCPDAYQAAKNADALLIATDWEEFGALDWHRIRDSMLRPLVIDGRNLLSPARMKSLGFEYISIGRPD